MTEAMHVQFNAGRMCDRQINELVGLALGLVADGRVNQQEAEFLQAWLAANLAQIDNPLFKALYDRIAGMLRDGVLDDDESAELFETLSRFSGADFTLGELRKATSLPLDRPAPPIVFPNNRFCFTGTFAFGTRRTCESAVMERGGMAGSLVRGTAYLVIGVYATDSWAHSSFGRKIEQALDMRAAGSQVAIIGEDDFVTALGA